MPAKKGKKGKKSGGKGKKSAKGAGKTPTVIDGVATEDMTKEEIEEHVVRIRDELDREREERNYFQLERDKINTFWEITKRQLDECRAEMRNKDKEMEDSEERHQVEIKVYKQKVKHLIYEHQNKISELKADGAVAIKLAQDGHRKSENELRQNTRSLKVDLKEKELSHEDVIKDLKLKNDELMSKMRGDFERQVREIEAKYEKKMRDLRDELELRRKTEIHEIEERKNTQINTLMKNHEKAFSDIKNYYNDITLNNLALINSLKEQVESMKDQAEKKEKMMNEIKSENKRLTEPLTKAKEEVAELRRQLANYEKDKTALASTKSRLKTLSEDHRNLKWEHETLEHPSQISSKQVKCKKGLNHIFAPRQPSHFDRVGTHVDLLMQATCLMTAKTNSIPTVHPSGRNHSATIAACLRLLNRCINRIQRVVVWRQH